MIPHAHGPLPDYLVELISENDMLRSKSLELGHQRRARSVNDYPTSFPLAHDTSPADYEGLPLDSGTREREASR